MGLFQSKYAFVDINGGVLTLCCGSFLQRINLHDVKELASPTITLYTGEVYTFVTVDNFNDFIKQYEKYMAI